MWICGMSVYFCQPFKFSSLNLVSKGVILIKVKINADYIWLDVKQSFSGESLLLAIKIAFVSRYSDLQQGYV